jgi:hypothetical protein
MANWELPLFHEDAVTDRALNAPFLVVHPVAVVLSVLNTFLSFKNSADASDALPNGHKLD